MPQEAPFTHYLPIMPFCICHHFHLIFEQTVALQVNRLEAFYPPQALQNVFNKIDRVDFKWAPFHLHAAC